MILAKHLLTYFKSNEILIAVLFGILISLTLIQQIYYAIGFAVILLFIIVHKKNGYLFFIIIALLSTSSDVNSLYRTIIQLAAFSGLAYLFFKHNGFNFSRYPKIPKELKGFLVALLIVMVVSTLFSDYQTVGIQQIIRIILFFTLVYFFYGIIDSDKNIAVYITAILISALIFSLYLIYEMYKINFNFTLANTYDFIEERSNYLNKNYYGSIISIAILIVLGYLKTKTKKYEKYFLSFFLIALFLGLIFSNSRASLVAVCVAIVFFIANINYKLALKIFLVIVTIFLSLLISPYSDDISIYLRLENLSTGREYLVQSVLEVISNNPVLGAGPAGTRHEMIKHLPFLLNSPEGLFLVRVINMIEFGQAHNFYLSFFSDLGVLGFILSCALPVIYLRTALRILKVFKEKNKNTYFLILSITSAGVFLFVRGFFESTNLITYGAIRSDLTFWLLFIIIIYFYMQNKKILQLK